MSQTQTISDSAGSDATGGSRHVTVTEPTPVAAWAGRAVSAARRANTRAGIQPAGWLVIGLTVACAVLGGVLGWVELRLCAVAGVVVVLCAIAFTIGRQTYAVSLRLQSRQVVVGERALGDLEVVNTSQRRLLPARIELPVGNRLASFALPSLAGKASHEEVFAVPTHHRAVIRVGPARTVRGDPFGLMGREIRWTEAMDLFVHPKTIRIPSRQGGFIRDLEGQATSDLTNSDVSFHALREYTPGDDRRYVHWKSSAKTGSLLVRQFEETRRSHVAVGLDLGAGSYADDDEFELAVSIAGSLALQALRDGSQLTVLTNAERLRSVTPRRTLDQLSSITMRARGDVFGLSRYVLRGEPNASVVTLVTGSGPGQVQLRRAGTVYDPDVRVLAFRVEQGADISVQTTANVSAVTVGTLEDLPRAVRRTML